MKIIYHFKQRTFFPLDGNSVEIRTDHSLLFGLINWTTTRKVCNKLSA